MPELHYSRRDFISFAGLALAAPAASAVPGIAGAPNRLSAASAQEHLPAVAPGDAPATVECLVFDANGDPLPPSALKVRELDRFHLCDLLMRPFTSPDVEETAGSVRFTPPTDRPFRIAMPLDVPGFGRVFSYADDGGRGWTARSLAQASPAPKQPRPTIWSICTRLLIASHGWRRSVGGTSTGLVTTDSSERMASRRRRCTIGSLNCAPSGGIPALPGLRIPAPVFR